jgi:hypothetical protein
MSINTQDRGNDKEARYVSNSHGHVSKRRTVYSARFWKSRIRSTPASYSAAGSNFGPGIDSPDCGVS